MKICLVLVVLAAIVFEAHGGGNGKKGWKGKGGKGFGAMKKCNGEEAQTSAFDEDIKTCEGEVKSNEKGKKKMMAKMMCVAKKRGVFVDDKFHGDKFIEAMTVLFPTNGPELGKKLVEACSESANGLKIDDPSTFGKMKGCIHPAMKKACKGEKKDSSEENDD